MANQTRATGGCQCGAVRYELTAEPLEIFVCHCSECRRQSASAFGISVYVPRDALKLTDGTPRRWSRPAASGGTVDCSFCGDCGSRLWHQSSNDEAATSIKGGSLDQPVDIGKAVHVWTSRRLPGVVIPADAVQYPEEPDT